MALSGIILQTKDDPYSNSIFLDQDLNPTQLINSQSYHMNTRTIMPFLWKPLVNLHQHYKQNKT